jgi:uncharacterized protein (TIGR03083 family)
MTMRRSELRDLIRAERERLVRDLRELPAEAWDHPSLCEEWSVRDVVGHLIRTDRAYRRGVPLLIDLARGGFRPQAALARAGRREAAGKDPHDLIEALSRTRYETAVRLHPVPTIPLAELLIHGQDIRRALELSHDIPPEVFGLAADGAVSFVRRLFGWGSLPKGVRFEAADVDWSTGSGEIARGPIEAVTMVLSGRRAALADLEGPAVERLEDA